MTTNSLSEEMLRYKKKPSLEPLPSLSPAKFPTFEELVEEHRLEQSRPAQRPPTGLFAGMLGDLTPLVLDFQRNPTKYGEETHALLEQLTQGSKSIEHLTDSERRVLDLATFDFFQAEPQKADAQPQRAASKKRGPKAGKPRTGKPVTELPTFWWRK